MLKSYWKDGVGEIESFRATFFCFFFKVLFSFEVRCIHSIFFLLIGHNSQWRTMVERRKLAEDSKIEEQKKRA